jgi:thiol-disulfide isomerase/thioredoxin
MLLLKQFLFYICNYQLQNMKRILLSVLAIIAITSVSTSQSQFVVYPDSAHAGQKVYKGIVTKEDLLNDTTFKWFTANQKWYTPQSTAVDAMKANKDNIELLVYMGTWCEDSHVIIPHLFKLADITGFDSKKITLLGTDRYKKTLSHLSEALNVKNVPTIIVLRNGKELGRVIEYGKYGIYDKELAEILTSNPAQ